jgi:hypothetical protein
MEGAPIPLLHTATALEVTNATLVTHVEGGPRYNGCGRVAHFTASHVVR